MDSLRVPVRDAVLGIGQRLRPTIRVCVSSIAFLLQNWLQIHFNKFCSEKSEALRERGVVTPLWSLMCTEGFATTTSVVPDCSISNRRCLFVALDSCC